MGNDLKVRIGLGAFLVWVLLWLAAVVAGACVVVHFIIKWW